MLEVKPVCNCLTLCQAALLKGCLGVLGQDEVDLTFNKVMLLFCNKKGENDSLFSDHYHYNIYVNKTNKTAQ